MNAEKHFVAARHTLDILQRLSIPDEHPAIIECVYVLAYHVLNGLMHQAGLSEEGKHVNSPSHSALAAADLSGPVAVAWRQYELLEGLRLAHVWSPSTFAAETGEAIADRIDLLRTCLEQGEAVRAGRV